ncbi:MAG: GrpB family protein [Flavobacteriia bacterium]|nr:GrpB family protein [Flavobacteriia bacterium]
MKIPFSPYSDQWPVDFQDRAKTIRAAIGDLPISIDHIGSTSVVGLGAKPIIDILIGVDKETELDLLTQPMIGCGYTYFKKYEPEMPYRRLFVLLKPLTQLQPPEMIDLDDDYNSGELFAPIVNVHSIVKHTHHWTRHIAFRDFLRSHPEVTERYYQLKLELSNREFAHHLEYNRAKNDFVKAVEHEALEWYQKH